MFLVELRKSFFPSVDQRMFKKKLSLENKMNGMKSFHLCKCVCCVLVNPVGEINSVWAWVIPL